MEKIKTQADIRHEEYLRHVQAAKDIIRLTEAEIDKVLIECGAKNITAETIHEYDLATV